ncbi:MAG: hypothetical protein ACREFI_05760, partial [Stellaceae bacterium]
DNGRNFRYRLYGSIVAQVSGFDMTGKLLSAHPASAYVTEFSIASACASLGQARPLYTERQPARAEKTMRWPRLLLPLRDDSGEATRLLVGSVPIGRGGRVVTG